MPSKLAQNSRCCKELEPQAAATEQFLCAETVADGAVDFLRVQLDLSSGPFFRGKVRKRLVVGHRRTGMVNLWHVYFFASRHGL